MKIFSENRFLMYGEDYIALAILENGVLLVIRDDGTAMGSDGEIYANVSKQISEDQYCELGWVKGNDAPITLI
ncbi:MAG: hypothetical protein PUB98_04705 [Clostridiales bacterium]|nr:hypothetical protein [Clostridiales bacterium]